LFTCLVIGGIFGQKKSVVPTDWATFVSLLQPLDLLLERGKVQR
jgi:hypothetical protein